MGRPLGSTNKPKSSVAVLERPSFRPIVHRVDIMAPAFGCADGYGHSAEQIALALERAHLPVRIVGMVRETGVVEARHILDKRGQPEGDAIIFYSQPNSWLRQIGRRGFGFSMYESDVLPQGWLNGIKTQDEVWVPASWQVPMFAEASGKPTYVVPLAVDAERFAYKRRERKDTLNFLHFATEGNDRRKGADLAVRAFLAAFTDRQDVSLTLRSQTQYAPSVFDPRIHYVFGQVPPSVLLDDYHAADCLVYPSRGEGFGMIPLEAMCSGMPAIYADATGPADYARYGLSVPARQVPAVSNYGGRWWEPEFSPIVDRMREVYTDYDAVMDRAADDAMSIRDTWTWDRTAQTIISRLNA